MDGWFGSAVNNALSAVGDAFVELVDDVEDTLDAVMGTGDVASGARRTAAAAAAEPPRTPSAPAPTDAATPQRRRQRVARLAEEWGAEAEGEAPSLDKAFADAECELALEGSVGDAALEAMGRAAVAEIRAGGGAGGQLERLAERMGVITRMADITLNSPSADGAKGGATVDLHQLAEDVREAVLLCTQRRLM